MIAHPDESPQHFTWSEGKLVLIDQNRHESALVDKPELKVYLEAHGLSNEPVPVRKRSWQESLEYVYPIQYQPFVTRFFHLPKVKLPSFSRAFGMVEFSGYTSYYTKQLIADIIAKRLAAALKKYSYVAYQAGAEEDEVLGIGIGWRTWFVNDVLNQVAGAELVVAPGRYPTFRGAVVCRANAEDQRDFFATLPHEDWEQGISPQENEELYD